LSGNWNIGQKVEENLVEIGRIQYWVEVGRILGGNWKNWVGGNLKNIGWKLEEFWKNSKRKLEHEHVGHNSAHFPEARGTVGLPVRAVEVGNKRILSEPHISFHVPLYFFKDN
jgi:hypothetical protein